MFIEPQRAADAPVVLQDAPQLQLAAAAVKRDREGGAGLQQLARQAQAGAGGAAAPGRRERLTEACTARFPSCATREPSAGAETKLRNSL